MSAAARFIVLGRVQGVHFRAYTQREAERLGLRGHAVNRRDGSVEVIAAGQPEAIDVLERWLHQGSPLARVESVQRDALPQSAEVTPGFRVG